MNTRGALSSVGFCALGALFYLGMATESAHAGGYLEATSNRAAGVRIYLRYDQGLTNTSFQAVGGASHLEIQLKKISGEVKFGAIRVLLNAGSTLYYSNLLSSYTDVGQSWSKITIPLLEMRALNEGELLTEAKLAKGVSEIGIYFEGGSGLGGVIGIDEIKLTGGAEDLVWYGDDHIESGDALSVREQNHDTLFISARALSGGVEILPPVPNQAPTVDAGLDRTITLPTNSLTLTGSAADSDGLIVTKQWTKISGPAATLSNSDTLGLGLSNLVAGQYILRLTVTDDDGDSATDDVSVIVNPAPAPPPGNGGGNASEFGNYTPVAVDGTLTPVARQTRTAPGVSPALKNIYGFYEYLPKNYSSSGKDYPLVIFFHGLGEKGIGDLTTLPTLLNKNGMPISMLRTKTAFLPEEAIVISPQSWSGYWNIDDTKKLMQFLLASYRVDQKRVYITGLSAGDYGTWAYAFNSATAPVVPAAIVPVSGNATVYIGSDPCRLKDIPTWVFHGNNDKDPNKPIQEQNMVETINASCNPRVQVGWTNFVGLVHDSWTRTYTSYPSQSYLTVPNVNQPTATVSVTYNRQMMWGWMFKQVRP